jgi:hypothetical protein
MKMMNPMSRPMIALLLLAMLGACDSPPEQYLLAPPNGSAVSAATGVGSQALENVDTPMPYARAPIPDQPSYANINSNNRSTLLRSGLSGDPANPSGAPGRPQNWDSL